ncbi:tubulin delta chain-like [Anneissia japonica]|uniref:tubulin delta chain-like n=1 Tax=Anneissia japonica TaxID=1529436 RepID=UPI0014258AC6|nr:tubulin delta chain-like [Anneissia japonica]
MTTVYTCIGQCGNQLGQQFFKTVINNGEQRSPFVCRDDKIRSLNVDSETKVLRHLTKDTKKSLLREDNVVCGRKGRGANWAFGYHGLRNDEEKLLDSCLDAFRKEVERCDCYNGTVMMHSLCGGTGSGFGSRLCEAIRDDYPMAYIQSVVVAPFQTGESPLQNYNATLCMAWLQRYSDSVFLYYNEEMLHRLSGLNVSKQVRDEAKVTINDINQHIAESLAGLYKPVMSTGGVSNGNEPWEVLQSVCPMPSHKFAHVIHTSQSKSSWEVITSTLLRKLRRYDKDGRAFSSLANLAVARGDKMSSFSKTSKSIENKIKAAYNCVRWNPFPVDFWISKDNIIQGRTGAASLTICANSSSVVEYADNVLGKTRRMLEAGAYLHLYLNHGCEQDDFTEAYDTVQCIIDNYRDAVK